MILNDTNCDYVFVVKDNSADNAKNTHIIHGLLIESTYNTIHAGSWTTGSYGEGYIIGYKKDAMRLFQFYKNGTAVTSQCTLSVYKQK